jgi:hypothetical protein
MKKILCPKCKSSKIRFKLKFVEIDSGSASINEDNEVFITQTLNYLSGRSHPCQEIYCQKCGNELTLKDSIENDITFLDKFNDWITEE